MGRMTRCPRQPTLGVPDVAVAEDEDASVLRPACTGASHAGVRGYRCDAPSGPRDGRGTLRVLGTSLRADWDAGMDRGRRGRLPGLRPVRTVADRDAGG